MSEQGEPLKSGKLKVALLELLHHHECLELPAWALLETGELEVTTLLGQFVDSRAGGVDGARVLPQPFRGRWLEMRGAQRVLGVPLELAEVTINSLQVISYLERARPDVLIVNTIDSPYLAMLMAWLVSGRAGKVVYTVHATDVLFDGVGARTIVKRSTGPALFALYERAAGLILLGDYVKLPERLRGIPRAVINNRATPVEKPVKANDKLTFVVAGSMDTSLRDYSSVLQALRSLIDANPARAREIRLHLLGRLNAGEVGSMVSRLGLRDVVETHDDFVPEDEFVRAMGRANFAIIPTLEGSPYGDYKISGPFGDALAFGLPVLLPDHYAPGYCFGENVIRYGPGRLRTVMEEILEGRHESSVEAAVGEADRHTVGSAGKVLVDLLRRLR